METSKKNWKDSVKKIIGYIKMPFCNHKKHYLIKSTKEGTLITHFWKCANCEKTFITYWDTRYDF